MEQLEGCYGCRSLARLVTEADATIAALQARVKELEARQHFGACAKCLTNAWRICKEGTPDAVEMKCSNGSTWWLCDYCLSKEQLTQRTAELEAANKHWDALWNAACEQKDTLQAELERVRGERDEANELVAALSSKVAEYEVELNGDPQNFYGRGRTVGLRTLIAALPKVEGEIRVAAVMHPNHFDEWHISAGDTWIMTIAGKQSADSVLCALQHRQGMEG